MIDTLFASFSIIDIMNRRFMYAPDTGALILGKQYKGSKLYASHAAKHSVSGTAAPFDSFVCGWVGTSKRYKDRPMTTCDIIFIMLSSAKRLWHRGFGAFVTT